MITVALDPHPLLDPHVFTTEIPVALGDLATPPEYVALLALSAAAPVKTDDSIREAVRRLLRHGGFKPSGRSKPASEYLVRAAADGSLGSINPAVDVCNIVSLHCGLPISVIDLARAKEPLRIAIAPAGAQYPFNASGQTIDLAGLLCLIDADGACANAVKDSQRTKTDAATRRTLTIIWGTNALPDQGAKAEQWYRELLHGLGATTESAKIEST